MSYSRNFAETELWDLTDDDDPVPVKNPLRAPSPASRDYQFGIALFQINSTNFPIDKCTQPTTMTTTISTTAEN